MPLMKNKLFSLTSSLLELISAIRMVVFDFDGVFTDNAVYVDEAGREMVRCFRGDGLGLARLREKGIRELVLSTEINPVLMQRCKKLQIDCFYGVNDKLAKLQS